MALRWLLLLQASRLSPREDRGRRQRENCQTRGIGAAHEGGRPPPQASPFCLHSWPLPAPVTVCLRPSRLPEQNARDRQPANDRRFLPTVPEAEVHDQGAGALGSGEGLSRVHRLAVASRGGRGQGAARGLFIRALIPFMGAPSRATLESPPKGPRLLIPSPMRVRSQHMKLGGTQTFGPQPHRRLG